LKITFKSKNVDSESNGHVLLSSTVNANPQNEQFLLNFEALSPVFFFLLAQKKKKQKEKGTTNQVLPIAIGTPLNALPGPYRPLTHGASNGPHCSWMSPLHPSTEFSRIACIDQPE